MIISKKCFTTLVERLQFSLGKINNDPIFTTIMTLATKKEYCLGLTCFSNPIFSVNRGLLTVRLLKNKYSLRPIYVISCMPDKLNYISSYHGAQATITDNILSFDKTLPSLPIDQLKMRLQSHLKWEKLQTKTWLITMHCPFFTKTK